MCRSAAGEGRGVGGRELEQSKGGGSRKERGRGGDERRWCRAGTKGSQALASPREGEVSADNHRGKPLGTTILG